MSIDCKRVIKKSTSLSSKSGCVRVDFELNPDLNLLIQTLTLTLTLTLALTLNSPAFFSPLIKAKEKSKTLEGGLNVSGHKYI